MAWAVFAASAQAQVVLFRDGQAPDSGYAGTRDTTLSSGGGDSQWDPNANYNLEDDMLDGFPSDKGLLLRWDLSALPPGTPITSAIVRVNVLSTGSDPYPAYQVLRPWSDLEATWLRATSTTSWAVPGAQGVGSDRGNEVLGTVEGDPTAWTLNDAGVGVVQRWVDAPATNFGLVIQGYSNSSGIDWSNCSDSVPTKRVLLELDHPTGITSFQNGVAPSAAYAGCTDTPIVNGATPTGSFNGVGHEVSDNAVALLSFDLGSLPPETIVTGAEIILQVTASSDDAFDVFEALAPWTEAAATWDSRDGVNPWAAPGATGASDHGTALLGTVPPSSDPGPLSVPLNAQGVQVVQEWVRRSRPNHGFYLSNLLSTDDLQFDDRETALPDRRPALQLTVIPVAGADAGTADAGPSADAGPQTDAGPPVGGDEPPGRPLQLIAACGCSAGPGGSVFLVAALTALARRRQYVNRS